VSELQLKDIHLRDPFVLDDGARYYLYGTRGPTVWTEADGFDCYTSLDLISWSGPFEVFHRADDFWADRSFWAPECFLYRGSYYLLATFGAADGRLGVQILKSDSPLGPFVLWSDGPVTPGDSECLDATLHVDREDNPHLVFSHSFSQAGLGEMCALELRLDLKGPNGDTRVLFHAADAPWVAPFPFAEDFGIEGDVYLADGPFLHRTRSGRLLMLWSSFAPSGYAVGIARSESAQLLGPWRHDARALFGGDGGHCMLFRTREGKLMMAAPHAKLQG